MQRLYCPKCGAHDSFIKKAGSFVRKSDSKRVSRYKCKLCLKSFSSATFAPCCNQNKRRVNLMVKALLGSSTSMRRIAIVLNLSRTTVSRKVTFLAQQARLKRQKWLNEMDGLFTEVQFDDLETFEHTKCKPISVCTFVEKNTYKIIDFKAYPIGAKGHLATIAKKKYGIRLNGGKEAREELFKRVRPYCDEHVRLESDKSRLYPPQVKKHFPKATHITFKGAKSSLSGYGELKRKKFDPLFSVNHSLAMLRDDLKRLARKTWCTTKKLSAFEEHMEIYVEFHNDVLKEKKKRKSKKKTA